VNQLFSGEFTPQGCDSMLTLILGSRNVGCMRPDVLQPEQHCLMRQFGELC
jgi:hypothetical protein